jgi:hypothetical protein
MLTFFRVELRKGLNTLNGVKVQKAVIHLCEELGILI